MANTITRKQFLTGAGAIAGAAVFAPAIARAARPTVIKFGCPTSPDHPVTKHAIAAASRIKQETGGEVTVQVFPNNELGNDTSTLASVRSGAVQMMAIADAILATLVPSAAIDNVGFSFKDTKTVFAALDGAVGDIVRRDIASHGLQPMPAIWDLGFREITTGTKPVETPDDLKGFKIRVPVSPILLSLFKDLGASPATMNVTELYTALETHVVDGQENPLSVIEMKKFYEVQKYCSLTNHSWLGFWMVMNGSFWQRLPADHQKAVAAAFDAEGVKERTDNENLNDSLQTRLTAQGLKFNKPDTAPFRALLAKNGFYGHWRKQFGPELWSALEKYTGTLA